MSKRLALLNLDMSLYEDPGRNHSESNREDFPGLPSNVPLFVIP